MLDTFADMILSHWASYRNRAFRLAVIVMQCIAVIWLAYEFWRLLSAAAPIWGTSLHGAVDLYRRRFELDIWFGDEAVKNIVGLYPPASYLMLWPLIGWLPMPAVRVVWALLSILCVVWLVRFTIEQYKPAQLGGLNIERRFLMWIPLSMYATGAAIGNGQHSIHVMPMMIAAIFMALRKKPSWRSDMLAAVLFIGALVKPQLSAPFFWMFMILPGRLRPAIFTAAGYAVLTAVSMAFQPVDMIGYVGNIEASANFGVYENLTYIRYADIGVLMLRLGLERWITLVTFFLVGGFGVWTWFHRKVDIWLLLGVTALFTRGLAYHYWFDDILLLLPLITLFRMSLSPDSVPRKRVLAGIIFVALWLSLLAPGGLYFFPPPYNRVAAITQALLWLSILIYLFVITSKQASLLKAGESQDRKPLFY